MKIERFSSSTGCSKCSGVSIMFKIDTPISNNFLSLFLVNGFKELQHFTKAGIFYVENSDLIVHGPFGTDKLQIKCKKQDCQEKLNNLESLLQKLG